MSDDIFSVLAAPATQLLAELEGGGFRCHVVEHGTKLRIENSSQLHAHLRARVKRERDALLQLAQFADDGVGARVAAFARQVGARVPGTIPAFSLLDGPFPAEACCSCGEAVAPGTIGRCWRCALAWRIVAAPGVPWPPPARSVGPRL